MNKRPILSAGEMDAARSVANRLQGLLANTPPNSNLYTATGTLQMRVGNRGPARSNFEAAVALGDPIPPGAIAGLAQLDLYDDNYVMAQQRLDELKARGLAGEATDLLQGDIWAATGKYELAYTLFERLANGGSRKGVTRMTFLATQQKDYDTAEKVLKDWMSANPEDLAMQMLLANLYMQIDRTDDARDVYESMLPTNDAVALNNLAWLYLDNDIDRAVEMARKANDVVPGNSEIQDTLGWMLVRAGSVNEGLIYLKKAARSRPDKPAVQYHLGVAYKEAGEYENALESLKRAVDAGDFDELDEARAELIDLEQR